MPNWGRDRHDNIDPPLERTQELMRETTRIADVIDVGEHLTRSETMANATLNKETTAKISDDELVQLAREHVERRNAAMLSGERLAKAMDGRSKTLIIAHGDQFYELSRNYSVGRWELPVGVASAEVLGYGT